MWLMSHSHDMRCSWRLSSSSTPEAPSQAQSINLFDAAGYHILDSTAESRAQTAATHLSNIYDSRNILSTAGVALQAVGRQSRSVS